MKSHKKHRSDNRGYSIVEIVIAVTIFAIVITPVLRVLIISAKMNYRSRERQKLTSVSESIMEAFKAYSLEEVQDQFSSAPISEESFKGCELDSQSSLSMVRKGASGETQKLKDEDGLVPLDEGEYYECVVNKLIAHNSRYDAVIKITAAGDSQDILSLSDMNPYTDGILLCDITPSELINQAWQHFRSTTNGESQQDKVIHELDNLDKSSKEYSANDIKEDNLILDKRQIVVDISNANGKKVCKYYMMLTYHIAGIKYYYDADDATKQREYVSSNIEFPVVIDGQSEEKVFYENPDSIDLSKVFIYYYPVYGTCMDEVEISSSLSSRLNLFVYKQVNSDYNNARLQQLEAAYQSHIVKKGMGGIRLYHNLNENIGSSSSSTVMPDIRGFEEENDLTQPDTLTDKSHIRYNIEVTVYGEQGIAGEPLTVLESSIIE